MKRISIVIVLAMLAPTMGGTGRYSSQRYRVRYSPYAFNYHNSGLIPGGLKYSPYAFQSGNSGLVYEGTRYTPYVFNYHNRGLVVDYYLWHTPVCSPGQVYSAGTARHVSHAARPKQSQAATRRRPARHAATSAAQTRPAKTADGTQVIRQYLQSRGFDAVDISRRLSIRNRTAGLAFILPDRNLVIRYTDPEILQSFSAESTTSSKVLNRYEQRWQTFAQAFEARGGTVYRIDTSDRGQILAALDKCDRLAPDSAAPQPTTLYAKN